MSLVSIFFMIKRYLRDLDHSESVAIALREYYLNYIYFAVCFLLFSIIADVRFLRVIGDRQKQLEIVEASHRGAGASDEAVSLGGHVGRDKVIDRIMQRYWWRNITNDVIETIKTCVRCQKASTVFKKVDSTLHNIPIKPKTMHQIGVDICSLTR